MSLLGLLNTEDFASERFTSIRRSVFYQYPNGAAPLLGLLSMLDGEVLNDPEFSWYEDRLKEKVQVAARTSPSTAGPWYANNAEAVGSGLATTAVDLTAGTVYWLGTNGIDHLRANDIIRMNVLVGSTATPIQLRVVANAAGVWYIAGAVGTATHCVRVTPLATIASALNTYAAYDPAGTTAVTNCTEIQVLGNANVQGQTGSSEGTYSFPGSASNSAQIFRTPYSFTGTALKTSMKFDESGPYKTKAKKFSMDHMIQMELQFLFGNPSKSTDAVTGLPVYTTGGVMFFLRLWEAGHGNAFAGKTNNYGNTAAATNADNQRIFNVNGNITEANYDNYIELLFRHTNNISSEKMVFCGSGFLNVMNKMYKGASVFNTDIPSGDAYGMNVVKHVSPFGTVYYKTHPLFSRNASMRYSALYFDAQNMKYRYLQDRDTDIKKNIQANNMDGRTDEWLTEAGMELQFPEANMYLSMVTGYSAT